MHFPEDLENTPFNCKYDFIFLFRYKNICQAQFEEATHLILIPHWALEDLWDQKLYQTTKERKTIVITTSGCGSELIFLTQLLTKVAKIR